MTTMDSASRASSFVLADSEKCTGCRACEAACFGARQKIKTVGGVTSSLIPNLFLIRTETARMPVQCHHCEDAPCLKSCLTGALVRREGAVAVVRHKCIGCKNCLMACPFGAITIAGAEVQTLTGGNPPAYNEPVFKCDLCKGADRDTPACVGTCPNQALRLVDADEELAAKRRLAADSMVAGGNPADQIKKEAL